MPWKCSNSKPLQPPLPHPSKRRELKKRTVGESMHMFTWMTEFDSKMLSSYLFSLLHIAGCFLCMICINGVLLFIIWIPPYPFGLFSSLISQSLFFSWLDGWYSQLHHWKLILILRRHVGALFASFYLPSFYYILFMFLFHCRSTMTSVQYSCLLSRWCWFLQFSCFSLLVLLISTLIYQLENHNFNLWR